MAELPPDDVLLDFDPSNYDHWDSDLANRLLVEQPELYRNHLAIARWIQGWADRMEQHPVESRKARDEGFVAALREVMTHLRQGDLVPGREDWIWPG